MMSPTGRRCRIYSQGAASVFALFNADVWDHDYSYNSDIGEAQGTE